MTNRFLGAALALASLVSPTIAAAQVADRAAAPSGTAPLQAPCVVQADGTCAAVKASTPMPTQEADGTPVSGTPGSSQGSIILTTELTGYRGFSFSLSGTFVGSVSPDCSNDGTNWTFCLALDPNNGSYGSSFGTTNRVYYLPATSRFARLRIASYTSGAVSAYGFLRQLNLDPGNVTIQGTPAVQGAGAVGNAPSGNGLRIAGLANSSTPPARTAGTTQDLWLGLNGQPIIATGNNGGVAFNNVWSTMNVMGDTQNAGRPLVMAPVAASGPNAATALLDAIAARGSTTGAGVLAVGNLGWTGTAFQLFRMLSDGTQVVSDLDGQPVPFTPGAAINAILFSTPTTGYAGVSYQANGSWSGTVSIEGSNDASADCQTGGTWFGLTSMNLNGGNPSTTINGNTGLFIPAATTCARARVSGYNSGSFTGVAVLRSLTPLPSTTQVNNYKAQFNSEVNNGTVAASAAKINYSTRDLGGGTVNYSRFTCYFDPGVASTGALGHIEGSPDNSNWTPLLPPVDLSTVTPVTRESRVFYRYNRCAFTNGSAAQTGLYVASQYGD